MHNVVVLEATRGQQMAELGLEFLSEDLAVALQTGTVGLLLVVGSLLMLLAGVGLLRLPDLPTRMHASTKAGSLGAALIMLGVAVHMPSPGVVARTIAVVAFLLLTAPVAAHVIARAGYFVGVPLWDGTVKDDLAHQYDYDEHTLGSDIDASSEESDDAPEAPGRRAEENDEVDGDSAETDEVDGDPEETDEADGDAEENDQVDDDSEERPGDDDSDDDEAVDDPKDSDDSEVEDEGDDSEEDDEVDDTEPASDSETDSEDETTDKKKDDAGELQGA